MKFTITFLILFFNFLVNFGQTKEIVTPNENGSIADQFEHLYTKSNNYSEFKVVKRTWITKLKKNTLDSLRILETKNINALQKIEQQQQSIEGLNTSLTDVKKQLAIVTSDKDSMFFLGFNFTKKSYKTLMWSIVFALLILMLFFIFKFKKSNTITKNVNEKLKELELEFEEHRRRSLEREQSVMRKLQDEINKKK